MVIRNRLKWELNISFHESHDYVYMTYLYVLPKALTSPVSPLAAEEIPLPCLCRQRQNPSHILCKDDRNSNPPRLFWLNFFYYENFKYIQGGAPAGWTGSYRHPDATFSKDLPSLFHLPPGLGWNILKPILILYHFTAPLRMHPAW